MELLLVAELRELSLVLSHHARCCRYVIRHGDLPGLVAPLRPLMV
jgi:hypothetical protein